MQRASATCDTPLAAATADFSAANKVDDGDWIVENFAPEDRAEVRALLNDAEIHKRNRALFQTKDARYIGGTVNYMNYVLLFVRDGSSAAGPVVLTLVKTGQGYRRTNVLSKDETFDIV